MIGVLDDTDFSNLARGQSTNPPLLEKGSRFGKCISWSKNGFIAYASPLSLAPTQSSTTSNKDNLLLTYLERVDECSWQLANAEGFSVKPSNDHVHSPSLSLVSWSNLSTDLAVSDIHGNFYIYLAGVGVVNTSKITSTASTSNGSQSSTNGSATTNGIKPSAGNGSESNGNANNNANASKAAASNSATNSTTGNKDSSSSSLNYELTSYNHLEMIYRDIIEPNPSITTGTSILPSINSIVAFKWLNIEKNQMLNKPASLNVPQGQSQHQQPHNASITYNYGVSQYLPLGVTHPVPAKQACVALRENGDFHLYYQGEHKVEYHKITYKFGTPHNPVNFKNASIGFSKDKKIIVVGFDTYSKKIKTFSISVDWGFLVQSAQKQKNDPHYQTPKEQQQSPKLTVKYLYEMSPISVEIEDELDKKEEGDNMDIDSNENSSPNVSHIGDLSCISLVSPNFHPNSELEILIGYDTYNSINDFSPSSTTFYRYKIMDQADRISEAFSELGQSDSSINTHKPNPSYVLKLHNKLTRKGIIQSVETSIVDSFVLLIFEEGHIDLIDRSTMTLVNDPAVKQKQRSTNSKTPPSTITTVFDIGFQFPKIGSDNSSSPSIISVSPNLTSLVYIPVNSDHKQLAFKVLESNRKVISSIDLFTTSVAFAFRHAYTCYTSTSSDDLLALIQSEVQEIRKLLKNTLKDGSDQQVNNVIGKFVESVICESHKAISFQLDMYGKEMVDKLLSNPPLQKLLSLQLILGEFEQYQNVSKNLVKGSNSHRVVKDIAWIVLNMRSTSFGIMFSLSSIFRQINKKKPSEDTLQDAITRAECITSLIGSIKWLIDLIIYLNQELLSLAHGLQSESTATKDEKPQLSFENSLALPLILSKIPRLLLMYAFSSLGKTNEVLSELHKDLTESKKLFPPMRDAFNRYFAVYSGSPLNIRQFEAFVRECDTFITSQLEREASVRSKSFQLKIEQKLVCQGVVPDEMQKIAREIVNKFSSMAKREINISELYFYNVDWLEVGVRHQSSQQLPTIGKETKIIYNYPELKPCISPRLHMEENEYIDGLRKIVVDSGTLFEASNHSHRGSSSAALRKCTRCRSISYVNDPLVFAGPTTIGLWTMVFQRTCLCGSAWINCKTK